MDEQRLTGGAAELVRNACGSEHFTFLPNLKATTRASLCSCCSIDTMTSMSFTQ
jgi:hypothetical protein